MTIETPEIIDAEIVEPLAPAEPTTAAVVHVPPSSALVEPVADLETIAQAYENYERMCERLLKPGDWQNIGNRSFVKKSGWRKLAVAMGVSVELLSVDTTNDGDTILSTVIARATAPNGRTMDGIGVCSTDESRFKNDRSRAAHDVPATAATRATNRACADLFGFGAVSAEEMQGGRPYDEPMENVRRSTQSSTAPASGNASEKQVKMLRARLAAAKKAHGMDKDTAVLPFGWAGAGLPERASLIPKAQVDGALKLIERAAESNDWEPVMEAVADVSSADPGFGAGVAPSPAEAADPETVGDYEPGAEPM